MKLIYIFIKQFRNIYNREITFSDRFSVSYNPELSFPDALKILPKNENSLNDFVYSESSLKNVHVIVGKTGAGKTNILQLIGMEEEERLHHGESGDSFFLLYEDKKNFLIEPFNIPVTSDLIPKNIREPVFAGRKIPEHLREFIKLENSMLMYRFETDFLGNLKNVKPVRPDDLKSDMTYIFSGFDKGALTSAIYNDEKKEGIHAGGHWQPRYPAEYHRTALWNSCRFLRDYINGFSKDSVKRKASLVIENSNWRDKIRQHIDGRLEAHDYWTFSSRLRQDEMTAFLGKKAKKHKAVSVKHQFIHDLLTDYALYLRKWISYIEMFPAEIPEENLDYYDKKETEEEKKGEKDRNRINPAVLPDFENINILKRIEWLSMYIDRKGDGVAKGLLWQIYGDIKDIGEILGKFDDSYFTLTSFSMPVTDMALEKNRILIENLFERMEMYRPDDAGIFTERLLPYRFAYISSGEYQFAKVMGGIEEYCVKLSIGENQAVKKLDNKPNVLYLLDEPETYMHPELCRTFLARLDSVLKKRLSDTDVQIIITTHSPLFLSDILPGQITRLDLDEKGCCIVKNGSDKAYFGANIHTILADGFFLNYTIGEFARKYLQDSLNWLKEKLNEGRLLSEDRKKIEKLKLLLPSIGDSVIRRAFDTVLQQVELLDD